jgi:hypothetical protein
MAESEADELKERREARRMTGHSVCAFASMGAAGVAMGSRSPGNRRWWACSGND